MLDNIRQDGSTCCLHFANHVSSLCAVPASLDTIAIADGVGIISVTSHCLYSELMTGLAATGATSEHPKHKETSSVRHKAVVGARAAGLLWHTPSKQVPLIPLLCFCHLFLQGLLPLDKVNCYLNLPGLSLAESFLSAILINLLKRSG